MNDIILNIFPSGSLAGSVTTTVWVGVTVAAFFNLRLGWTLSGLVVPGYLIPLFILKPIAAYVIIGEGIITYFIVLWLFHYLTCLGLWTTAFGRDRFFALLLISVWVRLICDGWLLPLVGAWINQHYSLQFDYYHHLHSFGLIIVALIANQFWKPGFYKGMVPFCSILLITYLIVRYVLMTYTNFTMSNIGYLYEDIAANLLASPKAYIIILTTAFLASHMNLQYGWEYSGILIPSLISLLWYHPFKIVVTMFETFIIIIMAIFVLRLPIFKKMTIEGARKILLFFNLSYAYKFMVAYLLLWLMPEKKITDFYGFGYLLPSLLAMKMLDKEIITRTTRVTIQTSVIAVCIASIIGFMLTLTPKFWIQTAPVDLLKKRNTAIQVFQMPLIDYMLNEKVEFYKYKTLSDHKPPLFRETQLFEKALAILHSSTNDYESDTIKAASWYFSQINFVLDLVEKRYWVIKERERERGWGIFIIDTEAANDLIVEVPAPFKEKGVMEAGVLLFQALNAKALAISGRASKVGPKEWESGYQSMFHTFHKAVAPINIIQTRLYNAEHIRVLTGKRRSAGQINLPQTPNTLWVKNALPSDLDLKLLKVLIGPFEIYWEDFPSKNPERESTLTEFAEIYLNKESYRKLFFKPLLTRYEIPVQEKEQRIDGYIMDWLFSGKDLLAQKGTNAYEIPKINDLLFFDEEIITPLLRLIEDYDPIKGFIEDAKADLNILGAMADAMNYQLIHYHHKISKSDFLILMEKTDAPKRHHWGTYIFRLGKATDYIIQIPRPLFEINVFEYGVSLFEKLKAKAILIGGTHKDANTDGSSDLIRLQNISNLFNLTSQALFREDDRPMMAIQIRALGINPDQPPLDADIVIAFSDGAYSKNTFSPLEYNLVTHLSSENLQTRIADGTKETAGYDVGGLPQSLYLKATQNKTFAILWLSPITRYFHRQQTENYWQSAQFNAIEIPTVRGYLLPYLRDNDLFSLTDQDQLGKTFYSLLSHYILHQDILDLKQLKERYPYLNFQRYIDMNTRQAFLMIYNKQSDLILVSNLLPQNLTSRITIKNSSEKEWVITRFIDQRIALLYSKVP